MTNAFYEMSDRYGSIIYHSIRFDVYYSVLGGGGQKIGANAHHVVPAEERYNRLLPIKLLCFAHIICGAGPVGL